ncbi:hypothetical protein [Streptomyces sp. SID3212]|uniref:hypothetical protein n=1 Tax=Streptomyces sp. SID3212 TaxID=2690259 RepID=UPI00136D31CB|nr:hypothetical protein [Streptomyces sp. SID3212]MYV53134.1 hypothetical protein [Streptomyces sp. SID3212]
MNANTKRLARWAARNQAADKAARRLMTGSATLASRLRDRTVAWIRAGRRDDLTGIPAALGCWLRLALVLAGLYLAWRLIRARPALLWLLVPLWLWISTRTPSAKEHPDGDDDQEDEEQPDPPIPDPADTLTRDDVGALLHHLYQEGSGVHLATLAEALPRRPRGASWATRDVRALLTRTGVRVRPGVRVPPAGGREGVHREDFPPLPPTEADPPVVADVAAGQSNNNNTNNAPHPDPEIFQDPMSPHRWNVRYHHRHDARKTAS